MKKNLIGSIATRCICSPFSTRSNNVLKIASIAFLLTLSVSSVSAQQKKSEKGEITALELDDIRKSLDDSDATVAMRNVISNNKNLKELCLNRDKQGKVDHYFNHRVKVSGITNQHSSGRCWMFTSMNALRPAVMKKYDISSFDFSHNYSYFWDIFEKSNLFLESIISTAELPINSREVSHYFISVIDDGGVWNNFYNVAKKYGVVPQSVMPETAHSDNTSRLGRVLKERLRKGGYELRGMVADGAKPKKVREAKLSIMKDVYRVLTLTLGVPPTEFSWRYKTTEGEIKELKNITPQQFFSENTPDNFNPNNYIMIMNDPTRDYYKVYNINGYRNVAEGVNWQYLNLPNTEIKSGAFASIKDDEAMYASCDVGKQANYGQGINDVENYDFNKLLGINLDMDKKTRILTRQSGSAHAMLLIGCDTDEKDNFVKWEFENSWGTSSGHNGYLTFTDKWFDEYMFRIVINKKYLSEKAVKALDSKPIQLPVWDYMF